MAEKIVECMQTYLGTCRVGVGTRARVETTGEAGAMRIVITEPSRGTELQVGEPYNVPASDAGFWVAVPARPEPAWDDDRSKNRQRHPGDPAFGP